MDMSLATLGQKTPQEVFDFVVNHLRTQNERAAVYNNLSFEKGSCRYRLEKDGKMLKCAAGCLMTDQEYTPTWETQSWYTLVMDSGLPRDHFDLISQLQRVHDNNEKPSTWEEKFMSVAVEFNLVYTPPTGA